jgi:hypothetical protein
VSRARGNALQNALARYLARWWEHAESAGAGRNGSDVVGTPGVVWECKTAAEFRRDFRPAAWVKQAMQHAAAFQWVDGQQHHGPVPIVVYYPAGLGEANTANTLAIVPLHVMMRVLTEAGYTPENTIAQKEAQV